MNKYLLYFISVQDKTVDICVIPAEVTDFL